MYATHFSSIWPTALGQFCILVEIITQYHARAYILSIHTYTITFGFFFLYSETRHVVSANSFEPTLTFRFNFIYFTFKYYLME